MTSIEQAAATTRFPGDFIGELRWQREMFALFNDPVWRGVGVPDGGGRPVLLVPGFLESDLSMQSLHDWLRRIGYRTYQSSVSWNVDCGDAAVQRLHRRLLDVADRTGERVAVVGHSRGGLFGRALGVRVPEYVRQVITLGSPLLDQYDTGPLTAACLACARLVQHVLRPGAAAQGCFTDACTCGYNTDLSARWPSSVALVSIFTSDDGVVRPSACRAPEARQFEVTGSHLGLVTNARVYRLLGQLLAGEEPPDATP